jgi:hypothetical protein
VFLPGFGCRWGQGVLGSLAVFMAGTNTGALFATSFSSCDAPGENPSKKLDNFFGPLMGADASTF